MKKFLLPALCSLAIPAMPAMAEVVTHNCTFTEACRTMGGNCQPENVDYVFELDAVAGTGQMVQGGSTYSGIVTTSNAATHFFFTNSAGSETTTIADTGMIIYSGNIVLGEGLGHYRLSGNCSVAGAPSPAGGK